jgi:putative hydrolase of the HAD superfamily
VSQASTLFFDVGGVLLTNAWDTAVRDRAVQAFGLDSLDFHTRHGMVKTAFETGRLSLDAYIQKTVFHTKRSFTPADFKQFMFEQSQLLGETLDWVRSLAASGKYRLFTLNNESRELHEYRVQTFGLCSVFQCFLTSCYLGQVKPDEDIYLNALGIAGCGAKVGGLRGRPTGQRGACPHARPASHQVREPRSTPCRAQRARDHRMTSNEQRRDA